MDTKVSKGLTKVSKVSSVSVLGMEARPVEVEVHIDGGLEQFHIVGLPSAAVRESRQRVRSAILSSCEDWPKTKVTVNLAPGDLRKEGSLLDLPFAIGILAAAGTLTRERASGYLFMGELALDGRLRPVRGAIAAAMTARELGKGLVLPRDNSPEAQLVPGVHVVGVETLIEAMGFANGELDPDVGRPKSPPDLLDLEKVAYPDMADVRGQAMARRALEVAAVGGHNLLMVGPPGSGKTMLAQRFPGILPPMGAEEALEVTRVWSVAGLLPPGAALLTSRPFRAPHHHASPASVIGGGHPLPGPGEISLAHRGVLFMDELPLFSRAVLEALRQPLEEGMVIIARTGATVLFPAQFALIAAANPCPCGKAGDEREVCSCPIGRLDQYRSRLSGPLLDRIDIQVEVARLTEDELLAVSPGESSTAIRARVIAGRKRIKARREAEPEWTEGLEALDHPTRALLRSAFRELPASARAFHRTLAVARSIADLEGVERVEEAHVAEALQLRRAVWR